jgi:hypothetical protein
MAFTEVDPTAIIKKYAVPPQYGPLRQFDREMRCASRGCGSPTHFKVSGIPRCSIHALRELNDMLAGVKMSDGD